MLGTDITVCEAACLINREFDDLLGARGQADFAEDGAVAPPNDEFDGRTDLVELDAEIREDLGGDAVTFAHQPEEDVLGADIVVVEAMCFFLGERQYAPRPFSELVEPIGHVLLPPLWMRPGNDYEPSADSSPSEGAAASAGEPSVAPFSASVAAAVASEES